MPKRDCGRELILVLASFTQYYFLNHFILLCVYLTPVWGSNVCNQFLPPLSPIPPLQQCYKGQTLKCSPINRSEKSTQALRTKFAGVQSMYILNFHHSTFSPALQEYSFLPIIQSTQHFLIWGTEELYDEIPSPLPLFLPSSFPMFLFTGHFSICLCNSFHDFSAHTCTEILTLCSFF